MPIQSADLGTSKVSTLKVKPFVLLIVAQFVLGLTLLFFLLSDYSPIVKKPILSIETAQFAKESDRLHFEDLLKEAKSTTDPEEAKELYLKAFHFLSVDYDSNPSEEKRKSMGSLLDFLQRNYPEDSKSLKLPCRQAECGAKMDFTGGLQEITDKVKANKVLNEQEKNSLLHNLENSSLAKGENDNQGMFNSLFSAYSVIKNSENSKNQSLGQIKEEILELMQSTYPEAYEGVNRRGLLTIK